MVQNYSYADFLKLHSDNVAILVDVRGHDSYSEAHIPQAIDIPLGELENYDFSTYHDKKIIFHCGGGSRALKACDLALINNPNMQFGILEGGFRAWQNIVKKP